MAFLATMYSDKPAAAFAIFKFIQSLGTAGAFGISSYTGLHVRLVILVSTCWLAAVTFIIVDCRSKRQPTEVILNSAVDGPPHPQSNAVDAATNTSTTSMGTRIPFNSTENTTADTSGRASSSDPNETKLIESIAEYTVK